MLGEMSHFYVMDGGEQIGVSTGMQLIMCGE